MKSLKGKKISILIVLAILFQMFIPINQSISDAKSQDVFFDHEVKTLDEDCEREIQGEINFRMPKVEKKKVDLVIVQDKSGSFKETIGEMKEGLKEVVDRLRPEDRAMLVTYGGGHKVQWYTLDNEGKQDEYYYINFASKWPNLDISTNQGLTENLDLIKAAIDKIQVGGATPTALGLKHALEDYEATKGISDPNRETIFLLVTDGVANVRLDGKLWLDEAKSKDLYGNLIFCESAQDYKTAITQSVDQAQAIKNKGYYLISTFIEDENYLSSDKQYGQKYKTEVGPYANDQLKKMATNEDYYIRFDNPDNFGNQVGKKLDDLIETFISSELEINIDKGYEILEVELLKDGKDTGIKFDKENQNINLVLDELGEGDYTFKYKLREKGYYSEDKNPANGSLVINGEKYIIPEKVVPGNENETCELVPTDPIKKVNEVEHVDLEKLQEEVTYTITTHVPNIYGLTSFILEDKIDDLLTINDESVKVTVDGEIITGNLRVEDNKVIFTKNDNFEEIKGKDVILEFKARIADGITYEQIKDKYKDINIPNKAKLIFNNNPKDSNTVTITPPEPVGKILLTKTDIDDGKLLSGAEFEVKDMEGNVVDTLVTNEEGKAESKDLPYGEYTVVEIKAPEGYKLDKTENKVKIDSEESKVSLSIKNEKLPPPLEPEIEKDVNGKDHLDLETIDEEYIYNVEVTVPEDVTGYESLIISDELEEVLNILDVNVLVDGNKNEELNKLVKVDGQIAKLTLDKDYDYESIAGKLITLEIKSKIKEDADLSSYEENTIPNKAVLKLNNNPEVNSNTVTVTPPEPGEPKKPEEPKKDETPKKPTEPKEPEELDEHKESESKYSEKLTNLLPKTGDSNKLSLYLGGMLLLLLGVFINRKDA